MRSRLTVFASRIATSNACFRTGSARLVPLSGRISNLVNTRWYSSSSTNGSSTVQQQQQPQDSAAATTIGKVAAEVDVLKAKVPAGGSREARIKKRLGSSLRHVSSEMADIDESSSSSSTSTSTTSTPTAAAIRASEPKGQIAAYSTSQLYDFDVLLPLLQRSYSVTPITEDAYHIRPVSLNDKSSSASASTTSNGSNATDISESSDADPVAQHVCRGEIFVFRNGSFVAWGCTDAQIEAFLVGIIRTTPGLELGRYDDYEVEKFDYRHSREDFTGINSDAVIIGRSSASPLLAKLAFSHGLARSSKLAVIETMLDTYLESTSHIPSVLRRGSKIPYTRSQILQLLGDLLHLRSVLNLGTDESLIDTPDYYWSKPQLEEFYNRICNNLDVRPRIAVLNKKLDYANEVASVLKEQLSENHSLKLEWCIILLITVEVLFEIVHYVRGSSGVKFQNEEH